MTSVSPHFLSSTDEHLVTLNFQGPLPWLLAYSVSHSWIWVSPEPPGDGQIDFTPCLWFSWAGQTAFDKLTNVFFFPFYRDSMFLWFISFYTIKRVALWRPAIRWKWMVTQDPAQPSSLLGVEYLQLERWTSLPRTSSMLWKRWVPHSYLHFPPLLPDQHSHSECKTEVIDWLLSSFPFTVWFEV